MNAEHQITPEQENELKKLLFCLEYDERVKLRNQFIQKYGIQLELYHDMLNQLKKRIAH